MNTIFKKTVWIIMAAPAVYLGLMWNRLPDIVALHFDLKGNPDRFGNKSELITTVVILVVVNALVYLLLTQIYRIDPKKYAAENKERLWKIAFATVVFVTAIICLVIYSAAKGNIHFGTGLIFSGTGLFFAIIGNYLPNLKPNYFAGLRLPWTLEDADNWKKTHQLAGKLWFAGGILLAAVCLFLPPVAAIVVFFTVMTILTLIPCLYSYRFYIKHKKAP